jgi:molecular chaperone HtpG
MPDETWPPSFTLDQERILNLLTGDRFYSNPSAALREAVLNAIDAVQRRRKTAIDLPPDITVTFNRDDLTVAVADNGIGMNRADVSALFTKVGASAATAEAKKESVGEFGIGVISYFMAGDAFDLQTNDGASEPIGLSFTRKMLAGGGAAELTPTQGSQGTTVTLRMRDAATFKPCAPNKRQS